VDVQQQQQQQQQQNDGEVRGCNVKKASSAVARLNCLLTMYFDREHALPYRLHISVMTTKPSLCSLLAVVVSLCMATTLRAFAAPVSQTCSLPKVRVIPAEKLFISEPDPSWFGNQANPILGDPAWTRDNWLRSIFHFSFAEYMNSKNTNFGVLRVLNDDLVQPRRGFGTHPHGDAEILTYVVEGDLTHRDDVGTHETLGRGSLQFMTSGTGIRHSE
jgi:hypothetical protein